jgi:hypothetical protein
MNIFNVGQTVVLTSPFYLGIKWIVTGFDGNFVLLQNAANFAHHLRAHPSNIFNA